MRDGKLQLLVKARPGLAKQGLSLAGYAEFKITDLGLAMDESKGHGAAAKPRWMLASAETGQDGVNPWDLCHKLVGSEHGLGAAGSVAFAEPDLRQQWLHKRQPGLAFGATDRCTVEQPQDADAYAVGPKDFWHLDDKFSGLRSARSGIERGSVRIAHLDTGYDPKHATKPQHLRSEAALARNYVDQDRPNNAEDEPTAMLNPMFGHGTATLAILAGGKLKGETWGGAPQFDVVPLRVANWVTLFENSAIVKAFDYVLSLWDTPNRIEVVTMSMGGLASQAWADAVNALYEKGIFVVTAAGNNYANVPGYIVYPARFNRVVAACGVMANGRPYADLPALKMAGCYGPDDKMRTAISAYTPNIPWAKIHCGEGMDWDGGGTSAATPQIAAAAALWLHKHGGALQGYEGWQRVEAVRQALFGPNQWPGDLNEDQQRLGRGSLQAAEALSRTPAPAVSLKQEARDRAGFALWKVLFGVAGSDDARAAMLELEALQLSQRTKAIEALLRESGADPANPKSFEGPRGRKIAKLLADHPEASAALRTALRGGIGGTPAAVKRRSAYREIETAQATSEGPQRPSVRQLRVYANDPMSSIDPNNFERAEAVLEVPWEQDLRPGPVGEYLEVVDVDPPSQAAYLPVDLNHPHVLANRGLAASEGDPQFHQQMVYAVAMKTIGHFEQALGRRALWAERYAKVDGCKDSRFVRRLRIYPHALREANAYYSPQHCALLFGYFHAADSGVGQNLPGGLVFSCLSHDIVAHETSHALLDGLHPRYHEMTNPDLLAFHEAFSDIVALFQHFTMPEALHAAIGRAQGDLQVAEDLGGLAQQFGQAIGERHVLRQAILEPGKLPTPGEYLTTLQPHRRGSYLVAAVFQAFLSIYKRQTADLFRIASGGTGVLPKGELHPDLVQRLAQEAAKIAERVLRICIRALDYCPPVDLSFGEYLRALITADYDVVPNDRHGYRVAFVSAFRAFGIFPNEVSTLSLDALLWRGTEDRALDKLFKGLMFSWDRDDDRFRAYQDQQAAATRLHRALSENGNLHNLEVLGLALPPVEGRWRKTTIDGEVGWVSPIEVHSVRPAHRVTPDEQIRSNLVVELTQKWSPGEAQREKRGNEFFRGGATVICDATGAVHYVVRKRLGSRWRIVRQRQDKDALHSLNLWDTYATSERPVAEPFALLHQLHEPG